MKRALVIGGTGPTGPGIVAGLLDRGYEVAVCHRGTHEAEGLPDVEHIHCDPHFEETLADGLGVREFELVVATYGRTRVTASLLAGRCEHFVGVGGVPVYRGHVDSGVITPSGMPLLVREDDPLADALPPSVTDASPALAFARKLVDTERVVFDLHREGAFAATWFRYPMIYGPRNTIPWEWSVIKRIDDGRPYLILPNGGLQVNSRMAADNAAHCLLLAVDDPDAAAGMVFNCADDRPYSLHQWVELVAEAAGGTIEVVPMPPELATHGLPLVPLHGVASHHVLVDTSRVRTVLGYRDIIDTASAIRRAVEWYRAHPVSRQTHPRLADPFDYRGEDELLAAYRQFVGQAVDECDLQAPEVRHSYAHPKAPHQADPHGR